MCVERLLTGMISQTPDPVVFIFCRWPMPGEAKTRLIPRFGPDGAAAIYGRLLAHTIAVVRGSGVAFELRVTGAPPAAFRDRFGADIVAIDQGDGDLSDRLRRAPAPAILIGSDCPGLTPAILRSARDTLTTNAAAIGPASDGGYYLLAIGEPADFAFADMIWSTADVFRETVARFAANGIHPAILPELGDVDEPDDLEHWPQFLP